MTTTLTRTSSDWTSTTTLDQLAAGVGMAVLLRGGEQAALFLLPDGRLCAVGNVDPFARGATICRGQFARRAGEPIVVSPLSGRAFSLLDGRCLAEPAVRLPLHAVQVDGHGVVQVRRARGWPAQ